MLTPAISQYALFWIVISAALFVVPTLGLGANAAGYYSNILQILSATSSALLCLRTMQVFERNDAMRLVWGLIGAGVLSWAIGQAIYTGYGIINNGAEPPYPWFSDIFCLLIQPLIIIALIIFARIMFTTPPIWGIVLSLLLLVITLSLAFDAAQSNLATADSLIERVAILAYALFDPLLLAVTVVSASLLTGGLLAHPWWLCFAGLVLYFISNLLFDTLTAQNIYVSGSWVDLGWVLSFILIGMAAMLTYNIFHH